MTDMAVLGARSNEIRGERSRLRRSLREAGGRRQTKLPLLADILEARPSSLDTVLVWDLLAWASVVRPDDRKAILLAAGIHNDFRRLGQLTTRQHDALIVAIRRAAEPRRRGR